MDTETDLAKLRAQVESLQERVNFIETLHEGITAQRNSYKEKLFRLRRDFVIIEERNETLECDLWDIQTTILNRTRVPAQLSPEKRVYPVEPTQDTEALKIREWRLKLEKGFMDKAAPESAQMAEYDTVFSAIENYDKLTTQYLEIAKLVRILRHIITLPGDRLPGNAEFKFRERSQALVDKWQKSLITDDEAEGTTTRPGAESNSAPPSPTKTLVSTSPSQMSDETRTPAPTDVRIEPKSMPALPASSLSKGPTVPVTGSSAQATPSAPPPNANLNTSIQPASSTRLPVSSSVSQQPIPLPKRKRKVDSILEPEGPPTANKAIRTSENSQRAGIASRNLPSLPVHVSTARDFSATPSPTFIADTLNGFKIKVEEAIILPEALLSDQLRDSSIIVIDPSPSYDLYPRHFLNWAYGISMMHLLNESRDKGRNFILPTPDLNPQMPGAPGQSGVLLTGRNEMLRKTWSLFSRVQSYPAKWLYLGEYQNVRMGTLPSEEFARQRTKVKHAWATKIKQNKEWDSYCAMRARIFLRLTSQSLSNSNIYREIAHIRAGRPGRLSEQNIITAFENGQEHVDIIRMDCVSYDHAFARHLKSRWRVWEAACKGKKGSSSFKSGEGSGLRTRSQISLISDEESDDDDSQLSCESEEGF